MTDPSQRAAVLLPTNGQMCWRDMMAAKVRDELSIALLFEELV
jgi:hypothetical protein